MQNEKKLQRNGRKDLTWQRCSNPPHENKRGGTVRRRRRLWPFKWLKANTLPLLNSGLREVILPMLDSRGGRTDHTAFFCVEVIFSSSQLFESTQQTWGWTASSIETLRDLLHMLRSDTTYWCFLFTPTSSVIPNESQWNKDFKRMKLLPDKLVN